MRYLFSVGQHTKLESEILTLNGIAIEIVGLDCETKWLKILEMRLDDKLSWVGQRAHVYQKAAAGTLCSQWRPGSILNSSQIDHNRNHGFICRPRVVVI